MVNQEFCTNSWRARDPLQQRLFLNQVIPGVARLGPPVEWQIVGVFHDVHDFGLRPTSSRN